MTGGQLIHRDTTALGTVANQTVPLWNCDLILVENAADASSIIVQLRRNLTGESRQLWHCFSDLFDRHFMHDRPRHADLAIDRTERRITNIAESENSTVDLLVARLAGNDHWCGSISHERNCEVNRCDDSAIDAGTDARFLAWRSAESCLAESVQTSVFSDARAEPNLLAITCRMMEARSLSSSIEGGRSV